MKLHVSQYHKVLCIFLCHMFAKLCWCWLYRRFRQEQKSTTLYVFTCEKFSSTHYAILKINNKKKNWNCNILNMARVFINWHMLFITRSNYHDSYITNSFYSFIKVFAYAAHSNHIYLLLTFNKIRRKFITLQILYFHVNLMFENILYCFKENMLASRYLKNLS